jgi:hypothetical protein
MAQSMIIWGLGKQDWRQPAAIVLEHGNRGFSGLWKVMQWSVEQRCVRRVRDCYVQCFAGSIDGSIEFEEEADATWCAARFLSLSAANACAAALHRALTLQTLAFCQAIAHLAACGLDVLKATATTA